MCKANNKDTSVFVNFESFITFFCVSIIDLEQASVYRVKACVNMYIWNTLNERPRVTWFSSSNVIVGLSKCKYNCLNFKFVEDV